MHESFTYKLVVNTHGQLVQVMDEIVRKTFIMWSQKLDSQYIKKLEQPLMARCKDKSAKLDVNFDKWVQQTSNTHKKHLAFAPKYV